MFFRARQAQKTPTAKGVKKLNRRARNRRILTPKSPRYYISPSRPVRNVY